MTLSPALVSSLTIAVAFAASACSSSADDGKQKSGVSENECGLHTQFAGDDNCILAPDDAYHIYAPNDEDIYSFKQQYRMRTGSHHVIVLGSSDTTGPEEWHPIN